jgi:hypothetical protein
LAVLFSKHRIVWNGLFRAVLGHSLVTTLFVSPPHAS